MIPIYRKTARHWPVIPLLLIFAGVYGSSLNAYGMFWWDEAEYASIGRAVLDGEGFALSGAPDALRPPILPLAGAASMLIGGERFNDTLLKMASWAFALLALFCVYGFAAAAYDRTAGFIAAFFLGIGPFFWLFVPRFMCEIPFMAFFAAAVWFFHFGAYRHERFFVWSWICLGLAFLTRYTASLFLPVILVFIPVALLLGGRETWKRFKSRTFLLSPIAGLLIVSPWLIREYVTFGSPFAGIKEASQQLQVYLPAASMPGDFYLRDLPYMLSLPVALLFGAGAIWALWKRERFGLHSFLTAAVIVTWFSCYRYKEDRLASSALPFIAVVAALPLAKATARLRPHLRLAITGVALAGIFVPNFLLTRPILERTFTIGYPGFLDAMEFLRAHASAGAVVLGANFPQIHWYSGLHAIDIPAEKDLPEALKHSEWVVITNFEPGQKPYVEGLASRLTTGPRDSVAIFRDDRFFTLVIRSSLLLE